MNLRRAGRGALTLVLAALALASPAAARVHLQVSPRAPIVDDDVTVSWITDRALRHGYSYVVEVSSFGDGCSRTMTRTSLRARRGERVSLTFSPYDATDLLGRDGGTEWCRGKAYATVDLVSYNGPGKAAVGEAGFRFRARP